MASTETQVHTEDIKVIAPGLVVLKGGLTVELQKELCNFALTTGNDEEHGFWVTLSNLLFLSKNT